MPELDLPLGFCLDGPPVSLQASGQSRAVWKSRVRAAATSQLPAGLSPSTNPIRMTVTYYHAGEAPDVDNVLKPIQDALNGLIYVDDGQIQDTRSRRRDINGSFRVRSMPPELATAFVHGTEFVHILIEEWADDGILI